MPRLTAGNAAVGAKVVQPRSHKGGEAFNTGIINGYVDGEGEGFGSFLGVPDRAMFGVQWMKEPGRLPLRSDTTVGGFGPVADKVQRKRCVH